MQLQLILTAITFITGAVRDRRYAQGSLGCQTLSPARKVVITFGGCLLSAAFKYCTLTCACSLYHGKSGWFIASCLLMRLFKPLRSPVARVRTATSCFCSCNCFSSWSASASASFLPASAAEKCSLNQNLLKISSDDERFPSKDLNSPAGLRNLFAVSS